MIHSVGPIGRIMVNAYSTAAPKRGHVTRFFLPNRFTRGFKRTIPKSMGIRVVRDAIARRDVS